MSIGRNFNETRDGTHAKGPTETAHSHFICIANPIF